jgi:hypothetical protein
MAAFAYQPPADGIDATAGFWSRGLESPTGPVVCDACGCRLEARAAADGSRAWYHYPGSAGRDARGCAIECSAAAHDASGSALVRA